MKVFRLALLSLILIGCATNTFRDCFEVYKPSNNESLDNFRIFKQSALTFNIKADQQLNWYENSKHALVLAIFQLKSPNEFQQLVSNEFGIRRLLESDSELKGDFLSNKHFPMQPASTQQIVLDRMEGAKFIGVVAGFYEGDRRFQSTLIEIPVVHRPKYYVPFFLSWLFSDKNKKPPESAGLTINLVLEQDRIANNVEFEIANSCSVNND